MLNLIKKIFFFIIPNSYVKRRHFNSLTYYHDNFVIMGIFNNNFLRKILFKFATLGLSSRISNAIYYRLFAYQKSRKKTQENNGNTLYEIDYGIETRDAIITSTKDKIQLQYNVKNEQHIWFGLALLENYFHHYKIDKHDLDIKISLQNEQKNKIIKLKFPVDSKKHGIAHVKKGEAWIDISLNLKEFLNSKVKITMEFNLFDKTFLMFPNKEKSIEKTNKILSDIKGIAISNPTQIIENNKTERIIYLSCESLTDPFWLEKINYSEDLSFKNIKNIITDSTHYKRSYSITDSTMPNIVSSLTGLSPSQHGFGNYNNQIFHSQINENLVFLPELLKTKDFRSCALTVYGRFDPLYSVNKGFDQWIQVNNPYDPRAPNANKITNIINFFKNQNLFLYCHLNRLHGPMLNTGTIENPSMISAESISDGLNYKFNKLYVNQLKVLDSEIGKIVNYLKSEDLYDNSTIIISGDHGASLPPEWKMGQLTYPLYELHSRVPLIIKYNKNIDNHSPKEVNTPVTAQIVIFNEILKTQNLNKPHYLKSLYQSRMIDENYAVSEVIYHPKENYYGISLIYQDVKFYKFFKINWKKYQIDENVEERIYKINKEGIVGNVLLSKDEITDYDKINKNLSLIVDENINFLKNNPHSFLPDTIKKIL